MKLLQDKTKELTLVLSAPQLLILMACIRESFATLDPRDYELRIGVPVRVASELADELHGLMRDSGIEE